MTANEWSFHCLWQDLENEKADKFNLTTNCNSAKLVFPAKKGTAIILVFSTAIMLSCQVFWSGFWSFWELWGTPFKEDVTSPEERIWFHLIIWLDILKRHCHEQFLKSSTETYKLWSSVGTKNNATVMNLKREQLIVIPDRNSRSVLQKIRLTFSIWISVILA